MSLGKRIAAARLRLPMTQDELAAKLGVTKQALSEWETGKATPEWKRAVALRRELRVTFSWLMEGDGPPPDKDAPEVALEDLPPDQQAAARAGLNVMLSTLRSRGAA